jgi:hypothetical protein
MSLTPKTYDSDRVLVLFAGIPVEGFAPDSRVTITPNSDSFTQQVGSSGEVVFSRTNNNTYTVTFHLMQTSASNAALSAIHNLDLVTRAGVGPLMIKDLEGTTLFTALGRIVAFPEQSFGPEAGTREWKLMTADAANFVGGN